MSWSPLGRETDGQDTDKTHQALSIIGWSVRDAGKGYTLGRQHGKPGFAKRSGDAIKQGLKEVLRQTGRHGMHNDWFAF